VLALVPLLSAAGFGVVGGWPVAGAIGAVEVGRRAMTYALGNPALAVLFTVTTREQKYKARAFIDMVVFRGGDMVGAFLFSALWAAELGIPGVAAATALVSIPWVVLAVFLGRRHQALARAAA
jgi:AAA family ATP:ADP antiporter